MLLYSLTAAMLLLAKVEDSDELVERLEVAKVEEVLDNILLALSVALSVGLLHLCCGLVAAFKPILEDVSQTLVCVALVIELLLLLVSFVLSHNRIY